MMIFRACAVLGEPQFHKMSQAYLAVYPSRSFQLRNLGQQLGTFLARHPQWAGSRQAMAMDMVKFEWAQIEAFDGKALPVLEVKDLATRNPAELEIRLQPYISLLRLEFPLDEFAIALKKNLPCTPKPPKVNERKHPEGLSLFRSGSGFFWRCIASIMRFF